MENEEIISFMATDNWTQFLLWERASRDTVDFKKIYVDMAGDLIAGLLLSQIVYWYLPTKDGSSKLRVSKGGHYWIAKARDAWWEEVRITAKQVDRALKVLEKKGLIFTHLYRFQGAPTKHIRIDTGRFLEAWKGALDFTQRSKSILPKGQNRISPKGEMDIDQRGNFLTETTTKTTKEDPEKENSLFKKGDDYLNVAAKCKAAQEANGNYADPTSNAEAEAALVAMYEAVGSEPPQKGTKAWGGEIEIVGKVLQGRRVTDPEIAGKAGRLFGQANRETPQFVNPHLHTFPSSFGLFAGRAKKQADGHRERRARDLEVAEASQAALRERQAARVVVEDDKVGTAAKGELALQMSRALFHTYVRPTSIVLDDGVLRVTAPDGEVKGWLENRLLTTIQRTAVGIVGHEIEVVIAT